MKFIQPVVLLFSTAILLPACKKHVLETVPVTYPAGMANLKIVHASPYTVNYAVQIKLNDTRVSNNITYSTPFPGGGLNTGGSNFPYYLSVAPGAEKIALSVPKAGSNTDSILLYTGSINIEMNKFYSAYLTDTGANTQTVLITENVSPVAVNTCRFKFLNLIPNVAAGIDLYFGPDKVASNIPYKGTSTEFILARGAIGQWALRPAGAAPTTTALAVYPAGTGAQTIPNQRIFTVYSRGYSGGTGNKVPAVSLVFN